MIIVLFTCACLEMQAQVNYVLNASLEQHSACPTFPDQIKFANYWSPIDTIDVGPSCSPEYCNICGSSGCCGVPLGGIYYYQYPRTGNGMAQVVMYFDESFVVLGGYKRDYLQGRLTTHLTAGKAYCVTFYVVLEEISKYAINHIGAYLDNGDIDTTGITSCSFVRSECTPQVVGATVITDTLNWTKVQGSFVANGSERFVTIGNFLPKRVLQQ
jgi:hypothetical protein